MSQPIRDALSSDHHTQMSRAAQENLSKQLQILSLQKNGWLSLSRPDGQFIELFQMFPKDELHQWFLGVLDHIFKSIIHLYETELRKPHLLKRKSSGTDHQLIPFFSDADILAVWRRLTKRMEAITTTESMVTISAALTASFMQLFVSRENSITLTGDRYKLLQLISPFVFRDLLAPEVT
jgi:hypothetical protein